MKRVSHAYRSQNGQLGHLERILDGRFVRVLGRRPEQGWVADHCACPRSLERCCGDLGSVARVCEVIGGCGGRGPRWWSAAAAAAVSAAGKTGRQLVDNAAAVSGAEVPRDRRQSTDGRREGERSSVELSMSGNVRTTNFQVIALDG